MGVGGYTDAASIEKWASKPEYYQKAGFSGLEEKVKDIFSSMCKGKYYLTSVHCFVNLCKGLLLINDFFK